MFYTEYMDELIDPFSKAFTKNCSTEFGRFRVTVQPKNISVGGPKYCVNISLHESETILYWLSTEDGGCALDDKVIRGEDTLRMTDLAFSLLRTYFPSRRIVTLLDDSGVSWKDARGKKHKVSLLKGHLFLYGKTWYEDKFGAKIQNAEMHAEYIRRSANYNNPSKKPEKFDFGELNDTLTPLYTSSNTWKEFAEKIKSNYPGPLKYQVIMSWYRQAIYTIFDGMEINQDWQIDVSKRPFYACEFQHGGTRKKTRKNKMPRYSKMEPYFETREIPK
jgi:hypothetical protein